MKRANVVAPDAMTVEIVRSKLQTMSDEMLHLLYRSAYSTLMRETRDCSFCLTTPSGALVTDGSIRYQFAIETLIANHQFAPGDIWIANHPYEVAVQHTPDLMVITPVYHGGIHLGFSCTIAHKSDVGGALVGSVSMLSTEIFQEGLLLPLMNVGKIGDSGYELDDRIVRLISTNVRDPDLFLGDMRAQIGVTLVGRDRLQTLAEDFGAETLLGVYDEILDLGERMIRRNLKTWRDDEVTVSGFIDNDGVDRERPVRYELTVRKHDDHIEFDFSGSDDQAVGPINMNPVYMEGQSVLPALLATVDSNASFNSGIRRAVTVIARVGSVFNPRFPAPVGASTTVMFRVTDLVLEALGAFVPDKVAANGGGAGGSTAILWSDKGRDRSSRTMQYEVLSTAQGASACVDGCNGTGANFYNNLITPIEILESQYPVRIERFELITDSGGPGRRRGGLSYRREYRCLIPATLNRRADRSRFPGNGIMGGMPGSLARLILNPGTVSESEVPIAGRYDFSAGESFMGEGAGGGGYGDPFDRDPLLVERDVALGYVSSESARSAYGVVIGADGQVNHEATEHTRSSAR
jgi:N-methylhydantoinase B